MVACGGADEAVASGYRSDAACSRGRSITPGGCAYIGGGAVPQLAAHDVVAVGECGYSGGADLVACGGADEAVAGANCAKAATSGAITPGDCTDVCGGPVVP